MVRPSIGIIAIAAAIGLSGCASLFNNKTPPVDFTSRPAGAEVYVNRNYVGTTPVEVELSIRKEHTVVFRRQGYADKTYFVSRSVGIGWVILDIIGGVIPVIVDAVTGDWFMLDTDNVHVQYQRITQ